MYPKAMFRLLLSFSLCFSTAWLLAQLTLRIENLPLNTPEGSDIYAAGSFNNWDPENAAYRFAPNADGQLELLLDIPAGNIQFKLTRGGWDSVEGNENGSYLPNRSYNYAGGAAVLPLTVQSWEDQGSGGSGTAQANVFVLEEAFYMPQLNRSRRIWIYLPPDYQENNQRRYPVLYMHDAQNIFDQQTSFAGEWEVDETLNRLFEADADKGAIVVGIDHGNAERLNELTPWPNPSYGGGQGVAYTNFIVETLKPFIDSQYRTRPEREYTGIMGSSLGGLLSMYAAIEHQDVFSKAGVFSPSFWFSASAYSHVANKGKQADMRIYLLGGVNESASMVANLQQMYQTLLSAGFSEEELFLVTHPDGAHSEWYWRREFGAAFDWLFAVLSPSLRQELLSEYPLRISPNPADSMLRLEWDSPVRAPAVVLFSAEGRIALPYQPLAGGQQLSLTALPKGTYQLFFYDGQQLLAVRKLILKR